MGRAQGDGPPTWFRLSEDSWAEIRREYQGGATARELSGRWRVSASSIYRHACEGGWTKKTDGDAAARANARALSDEQAADEAAGWPGAKGGPLGPGAVAALFPPRISEALGEPPALLREIALTAAGEAMRLGRLAEAQALAKLAEIYDRMAGRDPFSQLEIIYMAVCAPGWADRVMAVGGDPAPDGWKTMYWRDKGRAEAEAAAEAAAGAAGGGPGAP